MIKGLIIGMIAGYIASKIQKGEGSGWLVNLFLGIIGGSVGSWLFNLLGLTTYGAMGETVGEIIVAVCGAIVVLWVFAKVK